MLKDNGSPYYSSHNNYSPSFNNQESRTLLGSLVGLTIDALVGALLGSNGVAHIDKDFSKLGRLEKIRRLSKLSK